MRNKMVLTAVRAAMLPLLLRALHVLIVNAALPHVGGSRKKAHDSVPERSHTLAGQINRITLAAGGKRKAVDLIAKQYLYRSRS